MQKQGPSSVKIVGFKRLEKGNQAASLKRLSNDYPLINVVLIEIEGSESERQKLKECQKWVKGYERIRLWKVSQKQAFKCIYQDMMKQPLPTYFISLLPIEELVGQPIQQIYEQNLKQEGNLNAVNQAIKDNVQRIKFIILKDNIESLGKKSYFHGGVALIVNRTDLIYEFLEEILRKYGSVKPVDSTSSINSEDMRLFAEQMDRVDSEGVALIQTKYQKKTNSDSEAWKLMNNTPGVGSYNITNYRL